MESSFYLGKPNETDLKLISSRLGYEAKTDDWFICTFHASDNLINRSGLKWSKEVLVQMQADFKISFIKNHTWDWVKEALGFCISGTLLSYDEIPEKTNQVKTKFLENQKIVSKEGCIIFYLTCALPKSISQDEINLIQNKVITSCSTGGFINDARVLCPNCTSKYGFEVGFFDMVDDDFLCNHILPYGANSSNEELGGLKTADYAELKGVYTPVELSLCLCGDLPGASLVE